MFYFHSQTLMFKLKNIQSINVRFQYEYVSVLHHFNTIIITTIIIIIIIIITLHCINHFTETILFVVNTACCCCYCWRGESGGMSEESEGSAGTRRNVRYLRPLRTLFRSTTRRSAEPLPPPSPVPLLRASAASCFL